MSVTGKFVQRIEDDRPCPLTGRVLGREDEDRVTVLWGDNAYTWQPGDDFPAEARVEWMDELTPARANA